MRTLAKDRWMQALYLGTMQVVPDFGLKQMTALVPSTAGERLYVVSMSIFRDAVVDAVGSARVMIYSCAWK